MSDSIPTIPTVPPGLREAAQRGILVPFVGAGVSRLAGCPNWPEFADRALRHLVDSGKFSFGQLAQIAHLNARVKLSIARGLQAEHKVAIDFNRILEPTGGYDNDVGRRIYGSLGRLGQSFVTTNYDKWLHTKFIDTKLSLETAEDQQHAPQTPSVRSVYDKVIDFTPANLNRPNTVFHLHGSLRNPDGMVMTTSDYVLHYANDRNSADPEGENRLLTFLDHLFRYKTVLFVGYGLEELEILEYVVQKARLVPDGGDTEAQHFMLQGYYSHESELMKSLIQYYKQCNIQLLPFLKDRKDYHQLVDVLEEFSNTIPASQTMHLQKLVEMESMLDD